MTRGSVDARESLALVGAASLRCWYRLRARSGVTVTVSVGAHTAYSAAPGVAGHMECSA
jgi:hypothetical protein